jgi:hypothetical protein
MNLSEYFYAGLKFFTRKCVDTLWLYVSSNDPQRLRYCAFGSHLVSLLE